MGVEGGGRRVDRSRMHSTPIAAAGNQSSISSRGCFTASLLSREPDFQTPKHLGCIDERDAERLAYIGYFYSAPCTAIQNLLRENNSLFGPCVGDEPSIGSVSETCLRRLKELPLALNPGYNCGVSPASALWMASSW